MLWKIQQKCPYCDVTLDYDAVIEGHADRGNYSIKAVTTPESTEHVWTHAPKDAVDA